MNGIAHNEKRWNSIITGAAIAIVALSGGGAPSGGNRIII